MAYTQLCTAIKSGGQTDGHTAALLNATMVARTK